jgi:hypothetical protein
MLAVASLMPLSAFSLVEIKALPAIVDTINSNLLAAPGN